MKYFVGVRILYSGSDEFGMELETPIFDSMAEAILFSLSNYFQNQVNYSIEEAKMNYEGSITSIADVYESDDEMWEWDPTEEVW